MSLALTSTLQCCSCIGAIACLSSQFRFDRLHILGISNPSHGVSLIISSMESLSSSLLENSRFTEVAVGVSVSCIPSALVVFRHLRGTYSRSNATPNQQALGRETDLSPRAIRHKRNLDFGSSAWRSIGESQSNLMNNTTFEMENRKTAETVVEGDSPPNGIPESEIHYPTAHLASGKPKAVSETKSNDSLC